MGDRTPRAGPTNGVNGNGMSFGDLSNTGSAPFVSLKFCYINIQTLVNIPVLDNAGHSLKSCISALFGDVTINGGGDVTLGLFGSGPFSCIAPTEMVPVGGSGDTGSGAIRIGAFGGEYMNIDGGGG